MPQCLHASIVPPPCQVACGHPNAHSMVVVTNAAELACCSVPQPAIVQPLVTTDGSTLKVYVIGSSVDCLHVTGPALLPSWYCQTSGGVMEHHSQCQVQKDAAMPQAAPTAKIAMTLKRQLGLTFFGFDLVYCLETGMVLDAQV